MVGAVPLNAAWNEHGFVVLRGAVSRSRAGRLRDICDSARSRWWEREAHIGRSVADETCASMRHVNHPAYLAGDRDAHLELVEAIADLRDPARAVLCHEPAYFCTTYWFNPTTRSRPGGWHRDTQFAAADDDAEMRAISAPCRVELHLQLALLPSDDIEIVPGSHRRWDTPAEYAIRKGSAPGGWESDAMPGAVRIALDGGDALLFNPLTIHRGRYLVDRPRRTLMVSFSKLGAPRCHDYFTHQPWLRELAALDGLRPETRRFYENFLDAHSSMWRDGDRFTPT